MTGAEDYFDKRMADPEYRDAYEKASGRTWDLDRFGERPLTVNKVSSMHRQAWAKHTKHERAMWKWLAEDAQVPHLTACRIIATPLHRTKASPQDVAACAPAVKAAIDGLVDAGVLDDDSPQYLTEVVFRPPWVCGADGLRLTIEENQ